MRILRGGLHFDLNAVLYTNVLFLAIMLLLPFHFRHSDGFKRLARWIFIFSNGLALTANVADTAYYPYTLRRTTANVFSQFSHENNIPLLFMRFITDYWPLTLFSILLILLLRWGYDRLVRYGAPHIRNKWLYSLYGVIAILISTALFIGGVRGDFKPTTRPITLSNAGEYVTVPREANIVLNTPFAIFRTLHLPAMEPLNYFNSETELEKNYTPVHSPNPGGEPFRPLNVVVLVLESYSREFLGLYNRDLDSGRYSGYTPFLDSLAAQSLSWYYGLANGRKSIDALPAIIAGLPTLDVPYVLSHYSSNQIDGLGKILKQKGYHTSFFHGAPNGSMGFTSFSHIAGYDHYFGKTEYEARYGSDDYDGYWGIWDEKFLHYFQEQLSRFPQPFHSVLFSVTSHNPFVIPAEYKSIFPEETMPICKTIRYTDESLRRFFREASTQPWYHNTLFVITADHCAASVHFNEYLNSLGAFLIPIIFYSPSGIIAPGIQMDIAQQTDIMPTILGVLHYDQKYFAFGNDLISDCEAQFAFNYLDGHYQLFQGDYLLLFDGEKSTALFDFKKDRRLQKNLLTSLPDTVMKYEPKIKALLQQYNNRLMNNNTHILP